MSDKGAAPTNKVNRPVTAPAPAPISNDFRVFAPLHTFTKSSEDGEKMWVGGICSTDDLDQQDEVIVAEGLDFATVFLARGWYNDNHKSGTTDVLGYPTDAFLVKPGDILPDGSVCEDTGWWTEGYLLNTKKGREVHELVHALQGTDRQLGFSIEGKVTSRKGNRVGGAVVHNVAITHCPVQTKTYMVALAKAMTAGHGVAADDIGTGPGDGSPVRTESLDGDLSNQDLDDKDKRKAMAEDLQGATAFPEHVIGKSNATPPVRTTDVAEVERWADALGDNAMNNGDPQDARLTKSEADIVARTLYPRLDRATRDNLITKHTGGI